MQKRDSCHIIEYVTRFIVYSIVFYVIDLPKRKLKAIKIYFLEHISMRTEVS